MAKYGSHRQAAPGEPESRNDRTVPFREASRSSAVGRWKSQVEGLLSSAFLFPEMLKDVGTLSGFLERLKKNSALETKKEASDRGRVKTERQELWGQPLCELEFGDSK